MSLSAALKAAEAAGADRHPRVAAVLLLLGHVFCRTARVTFAEGLFRDGAKMLSIDVGRLLGQGELLDAADAAAGVLLAGAPAPAGGNPTNGSSTSSAASGPAGAADAGSSTGQQHREVVERVVQAVHGLKPLACHASLAAALCWRYCQLLSALPNRGSEVRAWRSAAAAFWARCGAARRLDGVLGSLDLYKGKGPTGSGALVSLQLRTLVLLDS